LSRRVLKAAKDFECASRSHTARTMSAASIGQPSLAGSFLDWGTKWDTIKVKNMKSALKRKMIETADSSMTPATNVGAIEVVIPSVKKYMLKPIPTFLAGTMLATGAFIGDHIALPKKAYRT
jgi:hypothetical protein